MGLDMYLERKSNEPNEDYYEEIGYWRKANAIHNWFVENVQNGVDDCDRYPVTQEQLEDLQTLCFEVMADHSKMADHSTAEKLLPTISGFFFGSTEYDEWYFDDIVSTIEILQKTLKTTDFDKETVYYCASW